MNLNLNSTPGIPGGWTRNAVLSLALLFPALVAAGLDGPLEYEVLGDRVIITGCASNVAEVTIPPEIEGFPVTVIGFRAFSGQTNLSRITFPDTVNSIEISAFEGCSNLATVNFGDTDSLTIFEHAFKDCTSLTSIEFPYTSNLASAFAFVGCTGLTSASFGIGPAWLPSLEQIFDGCPNLATVEFSSEHPSITSIGGVVYDKAVQQLIYVPPGFQGIYSLPDSIEFVDTRLFSACSKMTGISVGETHPNHSSLNGVLYNKSGTTLMKVPAGTSGDFVVPDGVTVISGEPLNSTHFINEAFAGCLNLTTIFIPSSVTDIGVQFGSRAGQHFGKPFAGCSSLKRIDVDPGNPEYASIDGVLFNKEMSTLLQLPPGYSGAYSISDSISSVQFSAFSGCGNLTSLTIGSAVSSLLTGAWGPTDPFADCLSLTVINAVESNGSYTSIDGVLFDKALKTLLSFPRGKTGQYTVPDGITSIGEFSFYDCSNLTDIEIPEGVTSIGNYAFAGCSNLTSVAIPDSVTTLGRYVFWGCSSLASADLGGGIMNIPDNSFDACTSLVTITLPESVATIGIAAFARCYNLESIVLPDSLSSIGSAAFMVCLKLTGVTIPDTVTSLGDFAFLNCTGLKNVSIGRPVNPLAGTFYNCYRLKSVTIPETVEYFLGDTFSKCFSLESVVFLGEPPLFNSSVFAENDPDLIVYYIQGTPGWDQTYAEVPTAPFLPSWGAFLPELNPNGIYVDTGNWLGWLDVTARPWVWCDNADSWIYITEPVATDQGGWVFVPELMLESPSLRLYLQPGFNYGWSYSLKKWLYVIPQDAQTGTGWVYML
jgi:hypothetical protein